MTRLDITRLKPTPLAKMGHDEKVGQQLALTGDLGRVYPSEGLRISGFAQRIGIKGRKVATQQKRNKTNYKERKQQGKG